ncbi:MAG: hypothetical protein JST16_09735 [Bdellovibrionales bacterium]|nr:hypothetical protein [Bdellovibrionales bacterium]
MRACFLPASLLLFCSAAVLAASPQDDWLFSSTLAMKLPTGWAKLSDSDAAGIGHELLVGKSTTDYARFFVSGDKLTNEEFRARMQDVIKEERAKRGSDLIGEPSVVPFQKTGLMLKLVFKNRLRGRNFFEAHYPFVLGGQGADVNLVAPLELQTQRLQELEQLCATLRPYWVKVPHDSGKK